MVATSSPLLLLVAATVLLVAPGVNAHGVIHKPEMKFKGTEYAGGYSAEIAMETMPAVPPDVYAQNSWADIFGRAFKQSKYKSLREYMLKNQNTAKRVKNSNPMTPECGFTDPENQKPVAMPDKLEWYGGGMNHPGPCEAWCDNEIVLPFTVNCQATYPDGKFPYDKSKCVGKNRFSFYWMATLIGWQVYIDCATIGSGPVPAFDPSVTAGGSSSAGNSTTPAASPAPAPAATRATSKAPAPAPAPAQAPAPTPGNAPATTPTTGGEASAGGKCKRSN